MRQYTNRYSIYQYCTSTAEFISYATTQDTAISSTDSNIRSIKQLIEEKEPVWAACHIMSKYTGGSEISKQMAIFQACW